LREYQKLASNRSSTNEDEMASELFGTGRVVNTWDGWNEGQA